MKIAFFDYLPLEYGGGCAKYFIETATGLANRYNDLDISIVTFDEYLVRKILFLYSIYYRQKSSRKILSQKNTDSIKKSLKNIRYFKVNSLNLLRKTLALHNIIYSKNDILELSILKYFIKYRNLPPVIIGCHTTLKFFQLTSLQANVHNFLYNSFFYKNLIKDAYKIHTLNRSEEIIIKRMLPGKTVVKISNPFDFANFKKNAHTYRYKYHWDKKKINILWVGNLVREKGVGDLVIIIDEINHTNLANNINWNIVGDGQLKNVIINSQSKWHNVHFLGYMDNKYLASIYKENDIFLTTSSGESYPYTLVEAQCFGLPVISYENSGSKEIITNNKTGYLVKTLSEFIDTLNSHIKHPILKQNLISSYVRSKYNIESDYKNLYQLFTG